MTHGSRKAPPSVVEEWISPVPDTAGKLVMLELWATGCGPCVAAIPENNRLQERFRANLVIIGFSGEPAEKVRTQHRLPIEYASAVDTQARMSRALGVREIPATFIILTRGKADGHPRCSRDARSRAPACRPAMTPVPVARAPGPGEVRDGVLFSTAAPARPFDMWRTCASLSACRRWSSSATFPTISTAS